MPNGFPSLQPALTVRVKIDAPMPVGGQAGSQLVIVPMVSGTVKSEEGFEPKIDGELYVLDQSILFLLRRVKIVRWMVKV
jgi:hypothetical protein